MSKINKVPYSPYIEKKLIKINNVHINNNN